MLSWLSKLIKPNLLYFSKLKIDTQNVLVKGKNAKGSQK